MSKTAGDLTQPQYKIRTMYISMLKIHYYQYLYIFGKKYNLNIGLLLNQKGSKYQTNKDENNVQT